MRSWLTTALGIALVGIALVVVLRRGEADPDARKGVTASHGTANPERSAPNRGTYRPSKLSRSSPRKPQMVTVSGHVSTPGTFEYKERSTIFAIINLKAGGPTVFGALSRVKVYRDGKQLLFNLRNAETKKQEFAEPGDIIEVQMKSLAR